ncbi:O-antigen polymerase [Halothece sp. PCC 7418]|uniref:O-antigen ligase family protein n=1 Tax=Halothece sp. (strain PCC 7418) TaxID=65093 RepID=UPI0002A080EF|nr:O-antigen ligase family protein [Halothece sp. PCC 7418]AFZ43517.1 O-antigen polymerase [Halothece sp. PCC 7418]
MNPLQSQSKRSSGQLFALLTGFFYILLTLIPDSHSLMVAWPWVLIWQVGIICPVLWFLSILLRENCFPQLGNKIDIWIALVIISLIITTLYAEIPQKAIWYSWTTLCLILALYALNHGLVSPQKRYRLLQFQGGLAIAFILVSLLVWGVQTFLPELERLQSLRELGVNVRFDFSVLELRNWAPLGHQNYVAGYLVLVLPLLIALGIVESGWRRWVWIAGVAVGLLDLYTTSSRGGWLGFFVVLLTGLIILLVRSSLPRLWLILSALGSILLVLLFILANNRLRSLLFAVLSGEGGGQFAYRLITMTVGWDMGSSHFLTGIGLGNVPWLYQEYFPHWAGYEAQLIYQLHSTPAQLFAELGLWAVLLQLGAIFLLLYLGRRWWVRELETTDFILTGSLFCAFIGYFTLSLTDYQLDNIAISGTLVIYLAVIASTLRKQEFLALQSGYRLAWAGCGFLVAVIIWLIPIHRAWATSTQGFSGLAQEEVNLDLFIDKLTQAHELVPWEPYYPYQLGWNLGDIALTSNNPSQEQALLPQAIKGFEAGLNASRDREFGYTNLGWLHLKAGNPTAATTAFAESAQLVPAKRGIFYGLGLSLLAQNQRELAVEALTLEVLRDPSFITTPLWQLRILQPIYPQVLESAIAQCSNFLNQDTLPPDLIPYFHRVRGIFLWWQGNLTAAGEDLEQYGDGLSQALLKISLGEEVATVEQQLSPSPAKLVFSAWSNPSNRSQLLQQAALKARKERLPEQYLAEVLTTMENAETFEEWLKQNPPIWQYRRKRLGFNVNMRQMGGAVPSDYFRVVENLPISLWFKPVFPTSAYFPELDQALTSQRESLLDKL